MNLIQRSLQQVRAQEVEIKQTARYPMEVYIAFINLLIFSSLAFECNDYLAGTTAYRHVLKMRLKALMPELEKAINEDLSLLISSDINARTMFNLSDGIQSYVEQLGLEKMVTHRPENIAGLGELLKQFHKMPELVLHRNGIKITDEMQKV